MTVDSSALIAVLLGEPEAPEFIQVLARPERKLMSAFSLLESAMVIESRKGPAGAKALAELVATAAIDTVAFDSAQAEVALDAWRRVGKARHPAGLKIGDCVSSALARVSNQALLFKCDGFPQTDIAEEIPGR